MTSDRAFRSALPAGALVKAYRRRAPAGAPLTLLIIGVSILGGIVLAIACSYRPIALWWVMIGCSAINLGRLGAQLARDSRDNRPGAPSPRSPLGLVARALAWSLDALVRGRSGTSRASLNRQHARFLVWFAEHNLLWTTVGFGLSLLLWHRFGPTTPTLVVMAALMSCGLFAGFGTVIGARAPTLGLCWREPCPTPGLGSLRHIVHDVGCVVVLANRREYAARCDWEKGGRFHELFLTVEDLARAGVEPGLEAALAADDAVERRALTRKERLDRALALTPVFAVALLAALLAVPPFAGSEPLPSLWSILTSRANGSDRASANGDEESSRDLRSGGTPSASESRRGQKEARERSRSLTSSRAGGNATSNPSQSGTERPDITGRGSQTSLAGDAVASATGAGSDTEGAAAQGGESAASGTGSAGSGSRPSSGAGSGSGSGGRGGGRRGYGTSGVAPQRAESPSALKDVPVNPGKAIEVVLPAFAQARGDSSDDDPAGTKRKADAPDGAQLYQPRHGTGAAAKEAATREPVQRLPNWIIQLLRK